MTIHLAHHCYLPDGAADDLGATCAIVLESSAPDSTIVGFTAAQLHGLWLPQRDEPIHIATAVPELAGRAMTRTRRPQFRAHRRELVGEDRAVVNGVQTLTLARTWRDLAAVLTLPDLVAAGDCALRFGARIEEIVAVIARSRGQRGARNAKAALPLLDARSRSRPESHLRVAITGPDMPRFEVNVSIYRPEGGWLAEPDLSLEEALIALEYQGSDHGKVKRMRKDITRFTDMRRSTWLTIPYGPSEVFGQPYLIKPEVREWIRVRAPHLLPKPPRPRRVVI
jgi:hypothetical protein